ncbi:DNA internalization-related competence protein ComEC/Rec2 [Desulfovibrio sp. OttesenSCG-928-F20]|nr:DNA internalization-related competence protein ComEC/Rec2 [Desulfovibrio sp. OttesenSCG-928-F20]
MRARPLAFLLFPEVCLLAAASGILALRQPVAGLLCLTLIPLLDGPRSRSLKGGLCLALFFALALGYTTLRLPAPPPVPQWLERAAFPAPDAEGEILPPGALRFTALVEDSNPLPGGRLRVILSDLRPEEAGANLESYSGRCVWTWYKAQNRVLPGTRIALTARLAPQRSFANPGALDSENYWRDRGVFFRAWSGAKTDLALIREEHSLTARSSTTRALLRERFLAALPRDEDGGLKSSAAILPALIFADRSFLTQEQTDLFARSTLAHSLALSGLHMGFAVLAGAALAHALGRFAPSIWLRLARPKLILLASLPFAGLYLWLGQAPPSLCRAALMLLFWTLLLCLNRPRVLLDGLLAAVAVLLLHNPLALFELSLQLSVLCVAVIALVLPGVTALARGLFRARKPDIGLSPLVRAGRYCLGILAISLCIQAALLPLVLQAFGSAGLLFPLNLIWLPVLGTLVLPLAFLGLLTSALDMLSLASLFLWLADLPCAGLIALLQTLDVYGLLMAPLLPRPHWLSMAGYWLLCLSLPVPIAALVATRSVSGLSFAHCRPTLLGLILLLAPLALAQWENSRPSVNLTLLDVGQGEAMLIQWSGLDGPVPAGRVLLDGGGFASPQFDTGKALLAPVLTDQALPRLDYVLNSHPDTDHLGGLPYILEHFTVDFYAGNADEPGGDLAAKEAMALAKSGLEKQSLSAGQHLDLAPGLKLECLWPPDPGPLQSATPYGLEKGNNRSLVLRLVWQGTPLALMCGDLEKEGLEKLMARNRDLAAQVLILPHHGSAGSMTPTFYDAVAPQLALASAGYGNRWGFPSAKVRSALAERGVPVFDSGRCGSLRLAWPRADATPDFSSARQCEIRR